MTNQQAAPEGRPSYEQLRLHLVQLYTEATAEHQKAKASGEASARAYWLARQEALLDVLEVLAGQEPPATASTRRPPSGVFDVVRRLAVKGSPRF